MPDIARDLALLRDSTDRLVTAAARLDDAALAAPSRLPGWTRGHVLTHLARNADALVNVLTGLPMYPSAEARDADIEAGAPRPLTAQLADLRETAGKLDVTFGSLTPDGWAGRCELRNGVTDVRARIPFRRLQETELHHVDLDTGYTLEQVPMEFLGQEIDFLTRRFSGNDTVPALALTAADGRTWRTGRDEGEPLRVTGEAPALMGWLAGRTAGGGVTADGADLPVLPPL
ncbi:maleylpyruvate isomerase family mycothiol-dependent enzyme [Streptomyces smaragdinus]|uniref:maleylpyruvate isomerase family mycothiol-dependent enzyme n=1 Tax=Streptomyces smaragdinus TaxID=2585196 RepID=UPI002B20348D|nr:maleylpyruvate isomerase family mycothiol-dependent enzyme [Streptomyces smaragdinus]